MAGLAPVPGLTCFPVNGRACLRFMSQVSSAGFGALDVAVTATPSICNTLRYIGKIMQ